MFSNMSTSDHKAMATSPKAGHSFSSPRNQFVRNSFSPSCIPPPPPFDQHQPMSTQTTTTATTTTHGFMQNNAWRGQASTFGTNCDQSTQVVNIVNVMYAPWRYAIITLIFMISYKMETLRRGTFWPWKWKESLNRKATTRFKMYSKNMKKKSR